MDLIIDYQSIKKKITCTYTSNHLKSIPFQGLNDLVLLRPKNRMKISSEKKVKMDPILGAIAAAAFSGIWNAVATGRANRYNSPRQQLKRLRKAGLPLAYMYQGRVNQQSDVPKLSIDPDLGTVEQKQLGMQRELTDEQIEKLAAEIRGITAEADIKEGERDWLRKQGETVGGSLVRTNQEINLDLRQALADADQFIASQKGRLLEIAKNVEDKIFAEGLSEKERRSEIKKLSEQVANLISQGNLMKQLGEIRSVEAKINKTIEEFLNKGDSVTTAIYAAILKLFSKL